MYVSGVLGIIPGASYNGIALSTIQHKHCILYGRWPHKSRKKLLFTATSLKFLGESTANITIERPIGIRSPHFIRRLYVENISG